MVNLSSVLKEIQLSFNKKNNKHIKQYVSIIGFDFLIPVFTNAQMATQTFVTDLQAMNPTVVQVQVGTMLHRIILRVMIEVDVDCLPRFACQCMINLISLICVSSMCYHFVILSSGYL